MKKYISLVCSYIATLGPVGYLPAPGTMGTLCALPLLVALRNMQAWLGFIEESFLVVGCIFLAVWIINQALPLHFNDNDPSVIVLDEVVGFMVTMLFFPLNFYTLFLGFIYFRFFDITKPFGIQSLERIGGGWGVILDDLAAALIARLALSVTFKFFL